MMNRTFSSVLVMLALGVLTPMQANAFGLGKLELSSALNEPFRAKIPVTALREDEEGNLQVRLATNEEFARAGIERSYYLTQLTFNIVEHPGGATIEVTSQQPIKEPFVDFLLTATTGEGRLIREYTVLLDPPKSVFVKPSKTITPTQAKKASPSPTAKTTHNYPESTYQAPSSTPYSGNTYGPTKRDDTLWDIALATKPSSSVSVHQMMIALLDANPSAFIKNNINNLKTGQTLTIPSVDEISKLSHRQAVARVSEQWQQWKNANKVVAEVQQTPKLSEGSDDGEILQTAEHASAGETDARLQLVVDSEDTPTSSDELTPLGNDELKKLRDQLTLAQETIEGQKQENIDFKARMDAMEQQLEIMRKIIMVKDADLARLQGMLGEEESGELASNNLPEDMQAALDENQTNDLMATEPEVVAEPQQTTDELLDEAIDSNVFVPAERMVDEEAVAAAAQAAREEAEYSGTDIFVEPDPVSMVAEDSLTEIETTTPITNELFQEHRMLDEAAVAAAVQSAKEEAAYSGQAILPDVVEDEMAVDLEEEPTGTAEEEVTEVVDASSKPVDNAPSQIGLLDQAKMFIAENKLPILGGLIAIFLGLLAWVFARRRNQDEYEWVDTESLEEATESEVTTAEPNIEEQLTDTSVESSTEEQAQDTSSADTTENIDDLLNKAEMSIAYGEYDEARETIEQAKRQDPNNQAITLKLLALAYHQKQTTEFNSLVDKVDLDKDSADWKEILAWGNELDPENELYKQDIANEKEIDLSEPLESLEDSDMADLEVESSLDESAVEPIEEQLTDSQDDSTLSFDNDFELEKPISIEDDTPLEFDTALTLDIETDKDSDITLTEESVGDDLDLVLDVSDLNDDADNMLDTELEELADNITEELPDLETVSIEETAEIKEEVEELDIGADDLEFDIGDFDEVDEAETKLDLAAAYVDMGDPDGAKNILNEVLEEGNDEQKSRAQDLLNNLAK